MNRTNKWRLVAMPLVIAAIATPMVACDQLQDAQNTLCCSDYNIGGDLTGVDWEVEGEAGVNFAAFMQATADFAGAATAMVNDVSAACQQLATDLGVEPNAVKETDPAKRATAWCQAAVGELNAKVKGKIQVNVQPPSCTINANVQANCEARCSANVSCEVTPAAIVARCDPGKLSGKCSAQCTGTCEGSANLAVTCEGTCAGTCEGQCQGNCSQTGPNGECRGSCDGTCTGQCRGSCQVDANANVQCEADCTGGCSVEVTAPKCKAELTPPSAECQGNAECSGSCKASASAKAECKEPSIEISGGIDPQIIASLKLNLPKIYAIAEGRGKLLLDNAKAVVDIGASIDTGSLSVRAGACLVPAVTAIGDAAANLQASVTASGSVIASVN